MDAVGPDVDVVGSGQVAFAECLVVGLSLDGEAGDGGRRETGRAAPELLECGHEVAGGQTVQVEQGSTSLIFGDLRHHGGRIAEENRLRSPVLSSMRRSFTRGPFTSTGPAAVVTDRGW